MGVSYKFSMRLIALSLCLFMVLLAIRGEAQFIPYHELKAFGNNTQGGLGGKVIKVTNLNNTGPGSFREAVTASGTRLVVFEVGGVIDMGLKSITISNPNLTIAGQTAPSPGITLIKGGIYVSTHDVVIQHIAIRPGDGAQAAGSWEPDGISTSGTNTYNVVFDHCSATWAIDENLSVSGPGDSKPFTSSRNVTLYRCLIAEGLAYSTHSKGLHSMGSLIHDGVSNVAIIECLYAHNNQRNPLLKGNSSAFIANCVIYNSGSQCIGMTDYGTSSSVINGKSVATVAGNAWLKGTNSNSSTLISGSTSRIVGEVYAENNILKSRSGSNEKTVNNNGMIILSPKIWPEGFVVKSPWQSVYEVLKTAGSRPARRDSIDIRIVQSVVEGTGQLINSQNEVGGYPAYPLTRRLITVPNGESLRKEWLDSLNASLDQISYLIDTDRLKKLIGTDNRITGCLMPPPNILLFPNPCDNHVTLSLSDFIPGAYHVILLNQTGQTIHKQLFANNSTNHQIHLDLSPESSGIYFIKVETDHYVQFKKLIRK